MSKKKWIHPGIMIDMVLRSLFKKPATVNYPFEKMPMPKKFRGKIKFEASRCIGCMLCVKDCPTDAIKITKVGDKQFEADFDLGKCIYCAQCVDSCARKALEATPEFELAMTDKDKLLIKYHGNPQNPPEKKD